jgi:hypothetical protein
MVIAQSAAKKYTEFGDDTQKIYSEIIESGFGNLYWYIVGGQKGCAS